MLLLSWTKACVLLVALCVARTLTAQHLRLTTYLVYNIPEQAHQQEQSSGQFYDTQQEQMVQHWQEPVRGASRQHVQYPENERYQQLPQPPGQFEFFKQIHQKYTQRQPMQQQQEQQQPQLAKQQPLQANLQTQGTQKQDNIPKEYIYAIHAQQQQQQQQMLLTNTATASLPEISLAQPQITQQHQGYQQQQSALQQQQQQDHNFVNNNCVQQQQQLQQAANTNSQQYYVIYSNQQGPTNAEQQPTQKLTWLPQRTTSGAAPISQRFQTLLPTNLDDDAMFDSNNNNSNNNTAVCMRCCRAEEQPPACSACCATKPLLSAKVLKTAIG